MNKYAGDLFYCNESLYKYNSFIVLAVCFIRTVMLKFVLSATSKETTKIKESLNFLINLECSFVISNKLRIPFINLLFFLKKNLRSL
jgi:hypothetical protein